ncbi:MAG: MarR family transcriptional regulator [Acidimicrobiales bacterium]
MSPSIPQLPLDRLAVGQLLVRLLHEFRIALFDSVEGTDFADLRFAHNQIWGNVGVEGIRLTDLAHKANLSLAACSELVNELQSLGYLERRADPTDGRAKLIHPTPRGRALLDAAGRRVAELEADWRSRLPKGEFDRACRALDHLLADLGKSPARRTLG